MPLISELKAADGELLKMLLVLCGIFSLFSAGVAYPATLDECSHYPDIPQRWKIITAAKMAGLAFAMVLVIAAIVWIGMR